MPRVNIEGVGAVNFPEGMTSEQITQAIERDILPRAAVTRKDGVADALKQNAESETGLSSFLIGAGHMTDKLLKGSAQMIRGGWLPDSMQPEGVRAPLEAMKKEEAENARLYKPLEQAHPYATTAGEIFAQLPFGVAGTGYKAAMAAGAIPGALEYGTAGDKALGAGMGAAGGAAGQALGNLIARFAVKRGAAPLVDEERAALVKAAQDMGYELTPEQITGKGWQRNLAAALRQNPASSGAMEKVTARQQANTERLVDNVLQNAGGHIDQPTAGAAAREGMQAGVDAELGKGGVIDRAYRDLLAGKEVNIEGMRPRLEQILAEQVKLPVANQDAKAVAALKEMLGTPGYEAATKRAARTRPTVDPFADDLITAVRKLGGINPADEAVGSLAKGNPFPPDPRLGPVWSAPRGETMRAQNSARSLDDMASALNERGYPINSPDDLMEAIANHGLGEPTYSVAFDHEAARNGVDPLARAVEGLNKRLDSKVATPGPKKGFIRENPNLEGELAQDLRSDYGVKSEDAYAKGSNKGGDAYREMKGAVDAAIERAVPDVEKGQFEAINQRYGLGKAVKMLPKKDQQVLLQQIYRGFKSEDEFAAFVGMSPDKEFRDVARGFLSNLTDKAKDKAGRVSAERLGREVRRADPDALRMLGQESGADLSTIGRIGENLLPDLPNSQTANRALFQALITGGGALTGGAYGGKEGGGMGATAGTVAGAFLAPKLVAKAFLSKTGNKLLTGNGPRLPRIPGLENLPAGRQREIADLLRALGAASAETATD